MMTVEDRLLHEMWTITRTTDLEVAKKKHQVKSRCVFGQRRT